MTHPPRSNPPLRSSSGPPSPCITPSTVTIVTVVSFMGSSFLLWWSFSFDHTEARISSVERGSVLQVHSASFPNILLVHRDPRQVAALACGSSPRRVCSFSRSLQVAFQPGEAAVDVEVALFADEPSDRRKEVAEVQSVPPAGLEPAHPAPEAGALSAELRGRAMRVERTPHAS